MARDLTSRQTDAIQTSLNGRARIRIWDLVVISDGSNQLSYTPFLDFLAHAATRPRP